MQPDIHACGHCQMSIVPLINEYSHSKGQVKPLKAACYPLVVLHAMKKFQKKESEHFELIHRVSTEKFQGICASEELQTFCSQVRKFHDPRVNCLKGKIDKHIDKDELKLFLPFHFTASYALKTDPEAVYNLAQLFKVITSISTTVEKYFFLNIGDHALGISINKDSYTYYDPNRCKPPLTTLLKNEIAPQDFSPVIARLLQYSEDLPLSLGIEVIAQKDLSQEMANCKELQKLQAEILKADPNQKSSTGCTPFTIAMKERHFDSAKQLVERGADPNLSFGSVNPAILQAVLSGDTEALTELINMKADIDLALPHERNPLWFAAYYGEKGCVEILLKKGAKIKKDEFGRSPQDAARLYLQEYRKINKEDLELSKRYHEVIELFSKETKEI